MIVPTPKLLIVLIIFCSLAFGGCKARPVIKAQKPEEKSAFFTLAMSRDTVHQTTSAILKNVNVINTQIRYLPDEAKIKEPNFLKITIVYKNKRTIQAFTEHPLYKRFDLYSESGQIEPKLISLPQGEVVFRVPYFDDYKEVIIRETVSYKESATIILKHEK
jgi:hypothetical protein